ncbi:TPA: hypothetical protein JAK17_001604 [Corynebacterium striatum]|nr:hypothetical protein [Corynebacterium striatum]
MNFVKRPLRSKLSHTRLPHTALALGAAALLGTAAPVLMPMYANTAVAHAEESCSLANAYRITKGHQDLAVRDDNDGPLRFTVDDDSSGSHVEREEGEFVVMVDDAMTRSLDDLGFPGISGNAWLLPQKQEYSRPWFGFSLLHLSTMTDSDTAQLTMELNSAPAGGRIVAWEDELTGHQLRLDSEDPGMAWDYYRSHTHVNLGFTEPGAYAVTFTFTMSDGSEHSMKVPFLVGSNTSDSELCNLGFDAGGSTAKPKNRAQQLAKDINDTGKAIAGLDKTLAGTLKEAEKLVGSPSSAKPTATKNAKKDKTGSTTAKKTSKEPTKDSSDGQKSGGSAQRGKTAPAMRSGGTTSDHSPKNSGSGNSGKGTAQKTADKQSDKKTQDAKGHGLRNPAKSHNLAAGDEQGYVETDAQEMSYEMPLFNFWAGFLAGMGVFALLLGTGLFVWVQFVRNRNRQTDAPAQQFPSNTLS